MYNWWHLLKLKTKYLFAPVKNDLLIQLERTLLRKNQSSKRVELLIDELTKVRHFKVGERALFVGCRNPHEIMYFKGFHDADAVGIDLYSEHSFIKIMDMHELSFQDDTFDLVFSSHSLEHSYNPQEAVNEFIRVMKDGGFFVVEVPVNYKVGKADRIDFKESSQIIKLLSNVKSEIIFNRYVKKGEEENFSGTDVVSLIIKVKK